MLAEPIAHPKSGVIIAHAGQWLDHETVKIIIDEGVDRATGRSPLTCEASDGVCAHCYGYNLGSSGVVEIGEAVGVIAGSQSGNLVLS